MAGDERVKVSTGYMERRMSLHMTVGRAAEAEDLAQVYRKRAGERFADGQDAEAKLFRGLSKELAQRGRNYRQRQTLQEEELSTLYPAPEAVHDER